MQHLEVELYNLNCKTIWDDFVLRSNQKTFLFQRDFMEYHSDRFEDFSILIFDNNELVALCPMNKVGEHVYSHQGLTYGGLLFKQDWDFNKRQIAIDHLLQFFRNNRIEQVALKGFPSYYNESIAEQTKNLYLDNGFKIYRTDKVLAIDYSLPFTIHKTKLKHYRKNSNKGFEIREGDFELFWKTVLVPRLKEKHNVQPVHTLDEILLLKSRFPNEIKQFNIYLKDDILAGITIFDKGAVVKSQYGATTKKGEKERALEYLFLHLIYKYKEYGKQYFSMGTVTEDNELGYNKGLLKQKEELGCTIYKQDFFKLSLND